MNSKILAAVALGGVMVAGAAAAQPYGYDHRGGYGSARMWHDRVATTERRIEQGYVNGEFSRRELAHLRAEHREFARHAAVASRGGVSPREAAALDAHFDDLIRSIRSAAYGERGPYAGNRWR